jgi:hypothetical protein
MSCASGQVRLPCRSKLCAVTGHAGFANAWHLHFMVNARNDQRGVGDRAPMPYVKHAVAHA